MVACNHNCADTSLATGSDGLGHLFSGWIDHPNRTDESHIKFNIFVIVLWNLCQRPHGKAQHTKGVFRHGEAELRDIAFVGFGNGPYTTRGQDVSTKWKHFIHGALCIGFIFPIDLVYRRHTLAVRVKGRGWSSSKSSWSKPNACAI